MTLRRTAASSTGMIQRNDSELISVVQNTDAARPDRPADQLASTGAGKDGTVDLLPFEKDMVDIVNKFIASQDTDQARRPDEAVPEALHRERLHASASRSIRVR